MENTGTSVGAPDHQGVDTSGSEHFTTMMVADEQNHNQAYEALALQPRDQEMIQGFPTFQDPSDCGLWFTDQTAMGENQQVNQTDDIDLAATGIETNFEEMHMITLLAQSLQDDEPSFPHYETATSDAMMASNSSSELAQFAWQDAPSVETANPEMAGQSALTSASDGNQHFSDNINTDIVGNDNQASSFMSAITAGSQHTPMEINDNDVVVAHQCSDNFNTNIAGNNQASSSMPVASIDSQQTSQQNTNNAVIASTVNHPAGSDAVMADTTTSLMPDAGLSDGDKASPFDLSMYTDISKYNAGERGVLTSCGVSMNQAN